MKKDGKSRYLAINPKNGLVLREATVSEINVYKSRVLPEPFDKPIRVGRVLIDFDRGRGSNPPWSCGVN